MHPDVCLAGICTQIQPLNLHQGTPESDLPTQSKESMNMMLEFVLNLLSLPDPCENTGCPRVISHVKVVGFVFLFFLHDFNIYF